MHGLTVFDALIVIVVLVWIVVEAFILRGAEERFRKSMEGSPVRNPFSSKPGRHRPEL